MVGYDPQSIFVKENYLFNMFGKQGHMLNYFIPFNFDKFSEKIYTMTTTVNTTRDIYLTIYNIA